MRGFFILNSLILALHSKQVNNEQGARDEE